MQLRSDETVLKLKERLAEDTAIPARRQLLTFKFKTLDDKVRIVGRKRCTVPCSLSLFSVLHYGVGDDGGKWNPRWSHPEITCRSIESYSTESQNLACTILRASIADVTVSVCARNVHGFCICLEASCTGHRATGAVSN